MELTFTEKTIIDIVSKNIIEGDSDIPCYLDEKSKYEDFSVCGVAFYPEKIELTGTNCIIEKVAEECNLKIEKTGTNDEFWWVKIPIKMFPTLLLLSKTVYRRMD